MLTKFRIPLAGVAFLLILIACSSKDAVQTAAPATDAVAATVNGAPISEHLVQSMLKQRTDLGREASAEARSGFIDRLAMQLVVSQEAVKKGLDKAPEVLDQMDLIKQSVLVDAFVKDYFKSNPISDDALKAEYEKLKAQTGGTEYKARHILVEKEADAKDIISKLNKNPKAFEALAKEKSRDSASKVNGGDLGWFDPRGMIPEFSAAVAKLAKGKFTEEPVKSQFGYHVILLEDTRPKQFQPLEQIKPQLTQQLQEQNLKKIFDEMKAKAKIEITKAPAPAPTATPEVKPEAKPEAKPAESPKK